MKYQDRVRIKAGFYEGRTGRVTHLKSFGKGTQDWHTEYAVKLDDGHVTNEFFEPHELERIKNDPT